MELSPAAAEGARRFSLDGAAHSAAAAAGPSRGRAALEERTEEWRSVLRAAEAAVYGHWLLVPVDEPPPIR